MSDNSDDDDANLPSAAECDRRCKEFAEVTGTDTALAMLFLQDRQWSLEAAVNDYFASFASELGTSSVAESSTQAAEADSEPHRIRVMTWNIDGLDHNSIDLRTKAVCQIIDREKPHVVFLQEVVAETLEIIRQKCVHYRCVVGRFTADDDVLDGEYFVVILLRNDAVKYSSHEVLPFHSSKMGRVLLTVQATVKGVSCTLMTSHLESTVSHTAERKRQLKTAFDVMRKQSNTVVFGGDLNLRDKELQDIGGVPAGVVDVWEVTGRRPEAMYTWDLQRNDNLDWSQRFRPRCRFDRLYHLPADRLRAVYFELVGLERLSRFNGCQRFPSDHWGIVAHFDKKD